MLSLGSRFNDRGAGNGSGDRWRNPHFCVSVSRVHELTFQRPPPKNEATNWLFVGG
jgi:hypothetical protein